LTSSNTAAARRWFTCVTDARDDLADDGSGRPAGMYRIGISGWTYPPWRGGTFYPADLPHKKELTYAAARLTSIEINGSFYSLQRPTSWRSWHDQTPDDFVFAVKGGRFITHMKKLAGVETPLANFFASGPLALGPKLGPILWQLPPNFGFNPERLAAFFDLLPRTTAAAVGLAHQHDDRMTDRTWLTTDADRPIRHALEIRHRSFETPEFVALLEEYDVALVTADTAGKWPLMEQQTAGFAYVRLHGAEELYVSGYTDEALDRWAAKVRAWGADGRDVFVYFDNDAKVHAPYNAICLAEKMGVARSPAGAT
jgi:uncharacterized protein YecE (DUF72 family)